MMNKVTGRILTKWILFLTLAFALSGAAYAANTKKLEILSEGTWRKESGYYRYCKADGEDAAGGFKEIDGEWYYFSAKGNLLTGLHQLDGKWFYFRKKGGPGKIGQMKTGPVTVSGKSYYFRKTGEVGTKGSAYTSKWKSVGGEKMYFTQDGSRNEDAIADSMTTTSGNQAFIKMIGPMAVKDMKKTGILASVTIAQAILESGYGSSSLALEAHNLFGMKASLSGNTWGSVWGGKTFRKKTWEVYNGVTVSIYADFRAYSTYSESLADHSAYLLGARNGSKLRYAGVKNNPSYRSTIRLIKNGGYATDPQYVSKIVNIIKRFKLTKYDKKAAKS